MTFLHNYYQLAKPGIVRGNLITAAAGYFLASTKITFEFWSFIGLLLGLACIIGSACVVNNILDIAIDKKMKRTKKRPLLTGAIQQNQALTYAAMLLIGGSLIMLAATTILAWLMAIIGFILYAGVYTYAKTRTKYATLIGSLPGAVPPVVGYTALIPELNMVGLVLFIILVTWQMPHFYAISLFRKDEYAAAGVPVWPLTNSVQSTRRQIQYFMIAFIVALNGLFIVGEVNVLYLIVVNVLGVWWTSIGLRHIKLDHIDTWARKVFITSLVVLLGVSFMIMIGGRIP